MIGEFFAWESPPRVFLRVDSEDDPIERREGWNARIEIDLYGFLLVIYFSDLIPVFFTCPGSYYSNVRYWYSIQGMHTVPGTGTWYLYAY